MAKKNEENISLSAEKRSSRITLSDIKTIVLAGNQAPTAHNWQVCTFDWDGRTLSVFCDFETVKSHLDVNAGLVWMSLGCVLANMQIAAQELGFDMKLDVIFNTSPESPVAKMTFQPRSRSGHPLYKFIATRCTNRRPYKKGLPDPAIREVFQLMEHGTTGVEVSFAYRPSHVNKVAYLASRFDQTYFQNEEVHGDLYKWLRWSQREVESRRNGIPAGALEFNLFDRLAVRAASAWPVAKIMDLLGGSFLCMVRAERLYRRSGAFGLIYIDGQEPRDYVRAGAVLERVWLTATRLGLSFHPLAGAPTLPAANRMGGGAGLSPHHRRLAGKLEDGLGRLFPVAGRKTPVMLFRVGYGPRPSARSVRKPIEDLLTIRSEDSHAK